MHFITLQNIGFSSFLLLIHEMIYSYCCCCRCMKAFQSLKKCGWKWNFLLWKKKRKIWSKRCCHS